MGRPATGGPRRIFGPVVGNCWGWSVVHGGVKVYRGNPAAARTYVEADHARVDDYYLVEGTGLAMRFVATPEGVVVARRNAREPVRADKARARVEPRDRHEEVGRGLCVRGQGGGVPRVDVG